MTLDGRKVEHLEKKGTQRVQGSIGLNHLSYEFQIDTWCVCVNWPPEVWNSKVPPPLKLFLLGY